MNKVIQINFRNYEMDLVNLNIVLVMVENTIIEMAVIYYVEVVSNFVVKKIQEKVANFIVRTKIVKEHLTVENFVENMLQISVLEVLIIVY